MKEYRGRTGLGAYILIFLGVVFLLINFGVVSANIWRFIFRLWPILLVLLGIRMILGRGRVANLLVSLLTLVILALILAVILAPTNPQINSLLNQYLPWINSKSIQPTDFES